MYRKEFFILLISIFLLLSGLNAQVPQAIADSLQNVLDLYQGSNSIPAISAAVNIFDVGQWTGTSGESYENNPLLPEMLMGIGSNTKTFTAALMMKFVEEGLVSLDDSLYQWLPNLFPVFSNIDSTVTIKQLLRHNSGIADYWTTNYVNAIFSNPDLAWTPEDVLSYVGPALFAPGTDVSYSNTNFVLAGMIIEVAGGEEYSTLIRSYILTELNLNNTFLEGFETVIGESAHPWHLGEDVYLVPRTAVTTGAFAAGCIKSTPEDMVNWFDCLFNQNFLSESSMTEMTDFINISGSINGVGCGIFRMLFSGKTYYLHSGNIRGYSSFTMYDVQDKHSISVLRNDTFVNCENVTKALANALNALVTPSEDSEINLASKQFISLQNYPNPFNPDTEIRFQTIDFINIPSAEIEIYNLKGQKIRTLLINTSTNNPDKSVIWNGTDQNNKAVCSGIYYAVMKQNESILASHKMLLMK